MEQVISIISGIPFETRLYVFIFGIPLLIILLVICYFSFRYRKKGGLQFTAFKSITKFGYILSLVLSVLTILISVSIILFNIACAYVYLTHRPSVVSTSPSLESVFDSELQPVTIYFDSPIKYESLRPKISPETTGDWTCNYIKYTKFCTSITFTPSESYEPEHQIIIYFLDITNTSETTEKYDESMPFTSPKIPKVESSNPSNGETKAKISNKITLTLSDPSGSFVDWKIENDAGFITTIKSLGSSLEILLDKELEIDSKYKFDVYQTIRRYKVGSNEEIFRGDTNKVYSMTFKTASSPSLKEYSPKGTGVLPDTPIEIVFNDPMVKGLVIENLRIEPEIEKEITWEDNNSLVINPLEGLQKDTTYTVSILPGVRSEYNVVTDKLVSFKFTTIGKVAVKSITPINGGTGYGINNDITIEFNQEVDKQSAQSHFSLSPAVSGTFAWSGKKMTYQVSNKLKYSTKYTVTLSPGIKSINGLDSDKSYKYTFTTRSQTFLLNVPLYSQVYSGGYFHCNIVATRMALGYRKVYVSSSSMISSLGLGTNPNANYVDGYGVHWNPISSYISKYRKNSVKSGWNVADLAKEVEKGNPVILWWWNRYHTKGIIPGYSPDRYRGMHSEVVVGFIGSSSNPTHLITNDPWRGRLTYTRSLFESTWSYIGKRAIVVY